MMDKDLLKVAASKIILKICVITGWSIDDEFYELLKEEFELKLVQSYPTVNVDEMAYAFRNNTEVKDWGKTLNLSLIDEVMMPYLAHRFEISKIEEQIKEIPVQRIYTDEEILNQRRAEIEIAFQAMKRGYFPIIHRYFSEVLIEDGFIKEEKEMSAFFSKSIATAEKLYEKQ